MPDDSLNQFELKVFEHWNLRITKVYSDSVEILQKEIAEVRSSLSQRGVLGSGVAIQPMVKTQLGHLRRIREGFREATYQTIMEWNFHPSETLKDMIGETLLTRYFNPQHQHESLKGQLPIEAEANSAKVMLKELWLTIEAKLPKKEEAFLSSAQNEFSYERQRLKFLIEKDAVLGRFFNVFIFEKDGAPNEAPPPDVYLEAARNCDIYIGIFGSELRGPVRDEFEAAGKSKRLIFFDKTKQISPAISEFKESIRDKVSWYEFESFDDLRSQVLARLSDYLNQKKDK